VLQQIGHQRWITIKVVLRRAELNRHILTLDISGVLETGMKGCDLLAACLYTGNHESDHRHRRLLCMRRKRPCNYSAAEKPDEFPSPHGPAPRTKSGKPKDYHIFGSRIVPFVAPSGTATMSTLGQKRTSEGVEAMSALPPKADMDHQGRDVRFVPKADIT